MISLMLSQVRLSVAGSCARYFQKLFTSSTCRVRLMSSNTARTSGAASRYSIGPWALMTSAPWEHMRCGERRYRGLRRRTTGAPVDEKDPGDTDRHADESDRRQALAKQRPRHQRRERRRQIEQTRYARRRRPADEEIEQPDGAERQHEHQPGEREHELGGPMHDAGFEDERAEPEQKSGGHVLQA